jgi:hypothetical protein
MNVMLKGQAQRAVITTELATVSNKKTTKPA